MSGGLKLWSIFCAAKWLSKTVSPPALAATSPSSPAHRYEKCTTWGLVYRQTGDVIKLSLDELVNLKLSYFTNLKLNLTW